ncbi:MAG: hypothetical protein CVV24_09545 [Ignavibacteriae bacterium HGW-Ignavibacteriae-3]|nr:MAG: hypothetical protein CVV24_09545 [Ignavibacteriae bacterium HGW-Ignavibacteriae-3]
MDYLLISKLHVVFAGIWLINFVTDILLRRFIITNKNKIGEKKFIHLYMTFANLFGIIGSTGILITGITLVIQNPAYGFFSMSSNHWLATKQILMVVLLIILAGFIIPTAKKVRAAIGIDLENHSELSEEGFRNLQKLFKLNTTINIIVVINFLLAITHRFIGS